MMWVKIGLYCILNSSKNQQFFIHLQDCAFETIFEFYPNFIFIFCEVSLPKPFKNWVYWQKVVLAKIKKTFSRFSWENSFFKDMFFLTTILYISLLFIIIFISIVDIFCYWYNFFVTNTIFAWLKLQKFFEFYLKLAYTQMIDFSYTFTLHFMKVTIVSFWRY